MNKAIACAVGAFSPAALQQASLTPDLGWTNPVSRKSPFPTSRYGAAMCHDDRTPVSAQLRIFHHVMGGSTDSLRCHVLDCYQRRSL